MANAVSIVHKKEDNALRTEAVATSVQNNVARFRQTYEESLFNDITPENFNWNNNTYNDFEIEEDFCYWKQITQKN